MKFIWTLIKWTFDLLMVLMLCAGLIAAYMAPKVTEMMASSLNELTTVSGSIISIDKNPLRETIMVREYPDHLFAVTDFHHAEKDAADLPIKPDDKVDLFIKKDELAHLNMHGETFTYGVRMADGRMHIDPQQMIDAFASSESQKLLKEGWKIPVAIPLIYFALCFVFSLFRRKK